jgi:hypothetical protein
MVLIALRYSDWIIAKFCSSKLKAGKTDAASHTIAGRRSQSGERLNNSFGPHNRAFTTDRLT